MPEQKPKPTEEQKGLRFLIQKGAKQVSDKSTPVAPKRIQRKRTKGWKMPSGAVYVGRPTRFGNPFWHAQKYAGLDLSLRCFRMACSGMWDPAELKDMPDGPFHVACSDLAHWLKLFGSYGPHQQIKSELRGKDLACWCRLDQPCHADILLEIANA